MFKHLTFAKQSYFEHFQDSSHYAWLALKASVCFLGHAIWPDAFQQTGSQIISELNNEIKTKYDNVKEN